MKTKIYQTIKGLIILFIKLQFSIRCNQVFRSLHTSTFNIYLNFSLNLNGLVTCIISNAFVSSPIRLMIPDVHLQRFLCIQSNQVQVYILIRPEGHWFTHQEAFVILVNVLIFLEDKVDICIKEKF